MALFEMKLTILDADKNKIMGTMELIGGKVVMRGFTEMQRFEWEYVGAMLKGGRQVFPRDGADFMRAVYADYRAPGRTDAELEEKK